MVRGASTSPPCGEFNADCPDGELAEAVRQGTRARSMCSSGGTTPQAASSPPGSLGGTRQMTGSPRPSPASTACCGRGTVPTETSAPTCTRQFALRTSMR